MLKIDKVNTEQCKLLFINTEVNIKRSFRDQKVANKVWGDSQSIRLLKYDLTFSL